MSTARVFNESVFNSYDNLKGFFERSNAFNQVLEQKDTLYSWPLNPLNPKLEGKWQVCQVASAPFRWIAAIALDIIAHIGTLFDAREFSTQLFTEAAHLKIGFNVYSENTTHRYLIQKSCNDPNAEGKLVNDSPAIPQSRIQDGRVKKRTFCSIDNEVHFGHHNGICKGESAWFLHLYFKTKNQFTDPRTHMAAIGKQFEKGGGMEPTLLQSLFLRKGKLLDLKIGAQAPNSGSSATQELINKTPDEWRSSSQEIIQQLQNLPSGAYKTGLPLHQTGYVKINPTLSYFFEPNHGVIEINGPEQGENLYELMSASLKETGEKSKKYPDRQLYLDVIPVKPRP